MHYHIPMTDEKTDDSLKKPDHTTVSHEDTAEEELLSHTLKNDALEEDLNEVEPKRHLKAFVFFIIVCTIIGLAWQNRDRIHDAKEKISRTFNDIGQGFGFAADEPNHKKLDVFKAGDEQPKKEIISSVAPIVQIPEDTNTFVENSQLPHEILPQNTVVDSLSEENEEQAVEGSILFPDILSDVVVDNQKEEADDANSEQQDVISRIEADIHDTQQINGANTSRSLQSESDNGFNQEERAALTQQVATLKRELKQEKRKSDKQRKFLKHFHLFSQHMLEGKNAETSYRRVVQYAPDIMKEEITYFAPFITTGIANNQQLQHMFDNSLESAFALPLPGEESSISAHLNHWFQSLVTIRKAGLHEGNDDEAIIARAEQSLKKGDVQQTIDELDRLSVEKIGYFADFIRYARNSIQARYKLEKMREVL